jgi:hypothetical protein
MVAQPYEIVPLYPVGSAASTGADMTSLMRMFLNYGKTSENKIIDSTTAAKMYEAAFRIHPASNPMRLGLMDFSENGWEAFGHGGDTFWFHSRMVVLPEADFGLFVSFNSEAGGKAKGDFYRDLMDRFFPEKKPLEEVVDISEAELQEYTGEYRSIRRPYRRLTKAGALMGGVQVSISGDKLKVSGDPDRFYVPIGDDVFREESSSDKIIFLRDDQGNIAHFLNGSLAIIAFEKLYDWEKTETQSIFLVVFGAYALLTFLIWGVVVIRKWKVDSGHILILKVSWFNTLCFVLFIALMALTFSNPLEIVYGIPWTLKVALFFPIFMLAFTIYMVYETFGLWPTSAPVLLKLHYTTLTIGFVLFMVQIFYWNMFGWNY